MFIVDITKYSALLDWRTYEIFYFSTRLIWLLVTIGYTVYLRVRTLAPKEGKQSQMNPIDDWAFLLFIPVLPEMLAACAVIIVGVGQTSTTLWSLLINSIAKLIIWRRKHRVKTED
tara:strand:- start:2251 stop:2598 length:348 start_codon:yes stop_codon:yes gene_type:complete